MYLQMQLFRTNVATGDTVQITPDTHKHSLLTWLHASPTALTVSLPLDRTAESGDPVIRISSPSHFRSITLSGSRCDFTSDLSALSFDDASAATCRKIASLPGPGWGSGCDKAANRLLLVL